MAYQLKWWIAGILTAFTFFNTGYQQIQDKGRVLNGEDLFYLILRLPIYFILALMVGCLISVPFVWWTRRKGG